MSRNLLIVIFVSFVNAMSIAVVIPVVYLYGRSFGLDDFGSSLLLTAFAGAQFLATPVIGKLSDRYGRKPLLVMSLAGTALSNLISAFAPSAAVLFAARLLDGITGGNNSVAQAVISDTTTPAERAKGFALFGAAFSLAFIIGPIASLFAQSISLSAPFLVAAAFATIATLVSYFFLPETLKTRETEPLTLRTLGFTQIWQSLRLPVINKLLLIHLLIALSFGVFGFAFQPFVISQYGFSSQGITLVLMVYGTVSVLMRSFVIGRLIKHFSLVKILMIGTLFTGIFAVLFTTVAPVWIFWLFIAGFAIASSLPYSIITSLISLNTKAEDQGVAIGVAESYFSLGQTFGPIIGGLVIALWFGAPLFTTGLFGLAAFGLTLAVRKHIHRDHSDAPTPDL